MYVCVCGTLKDRDRHARVRRLTSTASWVLRKLETYTEKDTQTYIHTRKEGERGG